MIETCTWEDDNVPPNALGHLQSGDSALHPYQMTSKKRFLNPLAAVLFLSCFTLRGKYLTVNLIMNKQLHSRHSAIDSSHVLKSDISF